MLHLDNGNTLDAFGKGGSGDEKQRIQKKFTESLCHQLDEIGLSDTLYITDPYWLNAYRNSWAWYQPFVTTLLSHLYPKCTTLVALVDKSKYDRDLMDFFKKHARNHGCELKVYGCNLFHDRCWLSGGNQRGIYVGHSLTGIGSKFTFVNTLPDADAQQAYQSVKAFLDKPGTVEIS